MLSREESAPNSQHRTVSTFEGSASSFSAFILPLLSAPPIVSLGGLFYLLPFCSYPILLPSCNRL
jgi:hypothetical protein